MSRVTLKFSLTPPPIVLRVVERVHFDVGSRTDLLINDQTHRRSNLAEFLGPRKEA
jgi:hypothetical protein